MEKAAKAEQRIKNVCDQLGITSGGRQWLDVAIDPFKDIAQKPIGFPDRVMTNSTVQTVHSSFDISGATVGATGNWDCNIFFDHLWKKRFVHSNTPVLPGVYFLSNQGVTGIRRGGLVVRAADSGVPLDITTTIDGLCQSLVDDVFENETSARVLGLGLEVHNTTSTLNKQGSAICYRVSDEPDEFPVTLGNVQGTANTAGSYVAVDMVEPPFTAAQAIDLPGSVQWDAEKGVYVVPQMIAEDNKPQDYKPLAIACTDASTGQKYMSTITASGTITGLASNYENARHPFGVAGAYFTGLSPETTLTVNLTYYVEQFPSFGSPLHRLATPSCPEDPAALELYTKVIRHMPTGVEVNDNFLGAFIAGASRVMQTVARYAPRVAGYARTVANVASGVSEFSRMVGGGQKGVMGGGSTALALPSNKVNNRGIREMEVEEKQIVTNDHGRIKQTNTHVEKAIVPYNPNMAPRARRRANGTLRVRNKRDKDFNRLDKYIKAGNAGNKYIM